MFPGQDQFINIHAHRSPVEPGEWVLESLFVKDYHPGKPGPFSVGIHPWNLKDEDPETSLQVLRKAASDKSVLAIGEAGLDGAIDTSMEYQVEIFKRQLIIASEFRLPVIIHAVKTFHDLIRIANDGQYEIPLIIHGFRGKSQLASHLLRAGFQLSFGPALLKTENVKLSFMECPLDKCFLETDDSETGIREVYEKAAEVKGLSIDQLRNSMRVNVLSTFSKTDRHEPKNG